MRIDLIGVDSAHRSDFGHQSSGLTKSGCASPRARQRATLAERVGAEVEALWINGPAGGGGVRRYAQERIGVVSLLLERPRVKPAGHAVGKRP